MSLSQFKQSNFFTELRRTSLNLLPLRWTKLLNDAVYIFGHAGPSLPVLDFADLVIAHRDFMIQL